MKRIKVIHWKPLVVGFLVMILSWYCWNYISTKTLQAQTQKKLQAKEAELDQRLNELNQSEQVKQELLQQKAELEKQLQAKRNAAVAYAEPVRRVFGGTCAEWVMQAGITEGEAAMALILKESGCNPNAVNRSSGACGVAQELPCGKSGCSLGDGACQVKWMNSYVLGRYGSWANALAFHRSHNWY